MLAVFIGLAMGLCAFLVDISLETLNNWKFGAVDSVIRSRGGFWRPYLAFIGICLLYSGRAPPASVQQRHAAFSTMLSAEECYSAPSFICSSSLDPCFHSASRIRAHLCNSASCHLRPKPKPGRIWGWVAAALQFGGDAGSSMSMCAGISGALVSFGSPLAAGSGIPEIKTYLNGVHVKGELSPSLESPALQSCFCSDYAPLEFMRIVRNHTSHGRALLKHL